MNKDLIAIFEYLEREKGIKREIVIKAIEDSLRVAAKKSLSAGENVDVQINSKTGDIEVFVTKNIVAKIAVVRLKKLEDPDAPKREPDPPPDPNVAPASAPLPCCNKTNTIIVSAEKIWITQIIVFIISILFPIIPISHFSLCVAIS